MGWFTRLFRGGEPELDRADENVLVISDIHLGEDVLQDGPEHLSGYIRLLNKELAGFVRAHSERSVGGRYWHLIIDGDMMDFVKVSVQPEGEEAGFAIYAKATPTAVAPAPSPELIVFKLQRILEIHRPLFREIARFLLNGHRVTIIEGNHDAEFYFAEVQLSMRAFVVAEAEKVHRREQMPGELDANEVGERLQFRPWFQASPGRYHIEHGHQYDEYCSFEYNLSPMDRPEGSRQRIAHPMSHRVMPYFVSILGDFSTHGVDKMSFGDMLRYIFAKGPHLVWVILRLYFVAMWELLRQAGRKRSEVLRAQAHAHREQLEALARTSPYGFDALTRLDGLKARPAEYSLPKMMQLFYFDRFLIGAVVLVLLLGAMIVGDHQGWIMAVTTLAVGALAWWGSDRTRIVNAEEKLRQAAAGIADLTGARYVVFGHSHHAELVDLRLRYGVGRYGESAYYLNSGSWVTRELMLGQAGEGMSYVEITRAGAALKRWHGTERDPEVLASTESQHGGRNTGEVAGTVG